MQIEVGDNRWIFLPRAEGLFGNGIQNAIGSDGRRVLVRQQRVSDAAAPAELGQNFLRVVTDNRQPDTLRL